jgi:hypothetical protein
MLGGNMDSKIRSQKLGFGDLVVEGWKIYKSNFMNILLVVLFVYIPYNIIILFIPQKSLVQKYGSLPGLFLNDIILQILVLLTTIATIGIALIVEKSLQGTTLSWIDTLNYSLSKWPSAIGTGLLSFLIVLGLSFLLIIPGIIWAVYYTFWVYVVAIRNIRGKTALDYSRSLVKGQWWSVLGTLFVIRIVELLIGVVILFIFTHFISNIQFLSVIPGTINDIVGSFFTVVIVVYFLNNDYRLKPIQTQQTPTALDIS